jgi:Fic family protein
MRGAQVVVFFSSDFPNRWVSARKVEAGNLIVVARGVYADEIGSTPEEIVRKHWHEIVANALPGAVVTYRSGFSHMPADGYLFVSHARERAYALPGLTVISDGLSIGALPDDTRLLPGLYAASAHRAVLDNVAPSRVRNGRPPRTLSRAELHDQVVAITQSRSDRERESLKNALRAQAHDRRLTDHADLIDKIFQNVAAERSTVDSGSPAMRSANKGQGYDDRRVRQFSKVADELRARAPRLSPQTQAVRRKVLPFFEAYFSNYIEGIEFSLEEAIDIALNGNIPHDRPYDAHDLAGTYRTVNDDEEMSQRLTDVESWISALKRRHAAVMAGRPETLPGEYKQRANRAGGTIFVDPVLVDGTLRVGYEILQSLHDPLARAVFTMYFVTEVHPFSDGNGRTARMMMNGELISAGQNRIIIPTALRREHISALTGVSSNDHIAGLYSVLDFAQRYTGQIDFTTVEAANYLLTETNAYIEPNVADDRGRPLTLPSSLAPYRGPQTFRSASRSTPT